MDNTLSLLGIAGAMAVGAMSPGPSFVMVARTAVASRGDGLAAALGMGAGGLVFAIAAMAGLQAAFLAVPALYLAIKGFGGAYLIYLGIRIWRGARQPLDVAPADNGSSPRQQGRGGRTFLLGLATQVSNPKTAVVYASIFAAFLPREVPLVLALTVVLGADGAGGHLLHRNGLVRHRCAGAVFGGTALRLPALQDVDRPGRRRRDGPAGPAAGLVGRARRPLK
jgi:threonine/homoserine/homoserine lactone efflux protein